MNSSGSRRATQFDRIGTNYKLSDVLSAIGLVQMRHIASLLERRTRLAQRYHELLTDETGIFFPQVTAKGVHSWQSCCVFTPGRDRVFERLKGKNIETQIGTYALHLHKAYKVNSGCRIEGELPGSRYVFDHCLTLPLYHDMTDEEQQYVVSELLRCVN